MSTMKKALALILLTFICFTHVWCQDNGQRTWKRHSIELSTGFPASIPSHDNYYPLSVGVYQPATADVHYKATFPLNATLTYSYRFNKLWAIGGRFNFCGWFYKATSTTTKTESVGFDNRGLYTSVFAKIYWLSRERVAFYSSAGIGINFRDLRIYPDLVLIGVQGSRKPVYLFSELSCGVAGLGLLVGIGYRFL